MQEKLKLAVSTVGLIMFWADNFTDAEYVGFVDDDAIITRAFNDYDLFDIENDRPRAIVRYTTYFKPIDGWDSFMKKWYEQSYWSYGNQEPAFINAMSYFPVIIKRQHLIEI